MAIITRKRLGCASLAVVVVGILAYCYFLGNYFKYHFLMNTYGTTHLEPWHWRLSPFPLMDSDGTKVFVDYKHNELIVIYDPSGGNGYILAGYQGTDGIRTLIGKNEVLLPDKPNACVFADESGARVVQQLNPGEARHLVEQLSQWKFSGQLRSNIERTLPKVAAAAGKK